MAFTNLSVALEQPVASITVNRPDKLNALNLATIQELQRAFDQAAEDPAIRVVVLSGAGDKAFVAGADIGELASLSATEALNFSSIGQRVMRRIENLGKPVIAKVNGYALGGGCELAMACTLRVAAETAKFGLPEISLGLLPGFGGTQRLARLIGRGRAMELALTGRQIDAAEAQRLGLATRIAAANELDSVATDLAEQLAKSAPIAMQSIIQAINLGNETPIERGLEYESQLFAVCTTTDDMREGTQAFLERRAANFSGR